MFLACGCYGVLIVGLVILMFSVLVLFCSCLLVILVFCVGFVGGVCLLSVCLLCSVYGVFVLA